MDILLTKAEDIEDGICTLEESLVSDKGFDNFLSPDLDDDDVEEVMAFQVELMRLENVFHITSEMLEDEDIVDEEIVYEELGFDDEISFEDFVDIYDDEIDKEIYLEELEKLESMEEEFLNAAKKNNLTSGKKLTGDELKKFQELEKKQIADNKARIREGQKAAKAKAAADKKAGVTPKKQVQKPMTQRAINRAARRAAGDTSRQASTKFTDNMFSKKEQASIKVIKQKVKDGKKLTPMQQKLWKKYTEVMGRFKGKAKSKLDKFRQQNYKSTNTSDMKSAFKSHDKITAKSGGLFARVKLRIMSLIRRIKSAFKALATKISETRLITWLQTKLGIGRGARVAAAKDLHQKLNKGGDAKDIKNAIDKSKNITSRTRIAWAAGAIAFLGAVYVLFKRIGRGKVNYTKQASIMASKTSVDGNKVAKVISKKDLDSTISGCKSILNSAISATKGMNDGSVSTLSDAKGKFNQNDLSAVGIISKNNGGTYISKKQRTSNSLSAHGYSESDLSRYKNEHRQIHELYTRFGQEFGSSLPNAAKDAIRFISNAPNDAYRATMTYIFTTVNAF